MLLNVLLQALESRSENYLLLISKENLSLAPTNHAIIIRDKITLFNRYYKFKQLVARYKPNTVLCFGNFAPPYRIDGVRVITYFHRMTLLDVPDASQKSPLSRLRYFLLKGYLKWTSSNTDLVLVQSSYVSAQLKVHKVFTSSPIEILPYYDESRSTQPYLDNPIQHKVADRFIYVSSDASHKNHLRLFGAWRILASQGKHPELLVTCGAKSEYSVQIEQLQQDGIRVVDLGIIPYSTALHYTSTAAFAIYPSLTESLGLGLVEAATSGCKVLCSDLPYTFKVIRPSSTFDPYDVASIAACVSTALTFPLPISTVVLKNRLPDLTELLLSPDRTLLSV